MKSADWNEKKEMMYMEPIGKVIFALRCEKKISQKKLARGIISVAELSRIENGSKEANGIVLEALLQRLGKSMDRLEYMASSEEYHEICLQEMICQALVCEKYQLVETLLTEYENCVEKENALCQQFVTQIRAITWYLEKKDIQQCRFQLNQALEITYAGWQNEELGESCLCTQEIQILLMIYYIQFLEKDISVEKIFELFKYIDIYITDKKERAKLYPQSAWLAGEIAFAEENFGKAYKLYKAGELCLAENGVLSLMKKILEDEKRCMEKMEQYGKVQEIEKNITAIDFLYKNTGKYETKETILLFILKSHQREVIISNELLFELRKTKSMSQEEISEGICAQETLSRIERQKRTPNRRTVKAIFEKLDYRRQFFQGYVVAEDYHAYELVGTINENWYKKNKKETYQLVEKLEKELDMTIPANKQYIGHKHLQRKIEEKRISREEELEELKKLLRYTMKDFSDQVYREPSRQEFVIINHMAICLKKIGRMAEAEKLYQQVEEIYKNSEVDARNHAATKFLFYINYVGLLEEENKLEEAENLGWEGINFMVECGKGDVAASLLANIACIYEKMPGSDVGEKGKQCLRNGYRLMLLYQHQADASRMRTYYENKYNLKID